MTEKYFTKGSQVWEHYHHFGIRAERRVAQYQTAEQAAKAIRFLRKGWGLP